MNSQYKCVVIGTSAGGIPALGQIFSHLPDYFPLPIIVVTHRGRDSDDSLYSVIKEYTKMEVVEARDKDIILKNKVYMGPGEYHVLVEDEKHLALSQDEPVNFSRPSVDVLFESAADVFGKSLIAIILTGANKDGAKGVRKVFDAGGYTIAENPQTSYMPEMPQSAIDTHGVCQILSLEDIAAHIVNLLSQQ